MKKYIVVFITQLLLILSLNSHSQKFYWVAFTDKNNSEFSLSNPAEYLSDRAIQRRIKQNIPIDSFDLPVNKNYVSGVVNLGVELVHSSKWLNGITVKAQMDSFEIKVQDLPFVKDVQLTKTDLVVKSAMNKFDEPSSLGPVAIDTSLYGPSVFQIGLMNGQFLHNQNFKGQGMHIAVLDAGFNNADSFFAFDSLWANNQILGIKDFVDPNADFFSTHYHGMSVLSCMGGNVPGQLIGTAPKASYWLLRSEDTGSEFLIEEDNWVVAAEFADSVGADVVNSSLGYYKFDDPQMNHVYADMDGKTTRVTQGANIAASRGMLVFASAGNEGNDPWKYLIAPSDGDRVIGVGAVNKDSISAPFTSFGPASDADVKPNVTGIGWNTFLQRYEGTLGFANGTSFSSPVMAGMGACLWQAAPNATADEVKRAIEASASLFGKPDSLQGYGIPDFEMAWLYLVNQSSTKLEVSKQWLLYPNPVKDYLILKKKSSDIHGDVTIEVFSLEGRLVQKWIKPDAQQIELRNIESLPTGILLMKISSDDYSESVKLSKFR